MVWINTRRKDKWTGGCKRGVYHFFPLGLVLWHPSFVLSGYGIDKAMIVDDFRYWYYLLEFFRHCQLPNTWIAIDIDKGHDGYLFLGFQRRKTGEMKSSGE